MSSVVFWSGIAVKRRTFPLSLGASTLRRRRAWLASGRDTYSRRTTGAVSLETSLERRVGTLGHRRGELVGIVRRVANCAVGARRGRKNVRVEEGTHGWMVFEVAPRPTHTSLARAHRARWNMLFLGVKRSGPTGLIILGSLAVGPPEPGNFSQKKVPIMMGVRRQ